MDPIYITEDHAKDLIDGKIVTYGAPAGLEGDVHPLRGIFELGIPNRFDPDRIYLGFKPDAEELAAMQRGEPIWFVVSSHRMPVMQVYVSPLPGAPNVKLMGGPHDGLYVDRSFVRDPEGGLMADITIGADLVPYALIGDSYRFVMTTD